MTHKYEFANGTKARISADLYFRTHQGGIIDVWANKRGGVTVKDCAGNYGEVLGVRNAEHWIKTHWDQFSG